MNISPLWMDTFARGGFKVYHWAEVGRADAPDEEIIQYAAARAITIFTRDLDFGIALARTGAKLPSVVQLRSNNVLPALIGERVIGTLVRLRQELVDGALVTLDPQRVRGTGAADCSRWRSRLEHSFLQRSLQ